MTSRIAPALLIAYGVPALIGDAMPAWGWESWAAFLTIVGGLLLWSFRSGSYLRDIKVEATAAKTEAALARTELAAHARSDDANFVELRRANLETVKAIAELATVGRENRRSISHLQQLRDEDDESAQ